MSSNKLRSAAAAALQISTGYATSAALSPSGWYYAQIAQSHAQLAMRFLAAAAKRDPGGGGEMRQGPKHAGGRPPLAPGLRRVRVDMMLAPATLAALDALRASTRETRTAVVERLILAARLA